MQRYSFPGGLEEVLPRDGGPDGGFEVRTALGSWKDRPEDCELHATHPAASHPAKVGVDLRTEDFVTLILEMSEREASRIWGTVADSDGTVVPGAFVDLFQGGNLLDGVTARSGEDGVYRMPPVAPGVYSLAARSPDTYPGQSENRRSMAVKASREYRIDLVADFSHTLEGRVLAASGDPLPDVLVESVLQSGNRSSRWGVLTNREGHFFLRGLYRGLRYEIIATHPDYQPYQTELRFPFPRFLHAVLEEGLTLGGVVNDSRGMPLSDGMIWVSLLGGAEPIRHVSLEGSSGVFEMRGLPPGTLDLNIYRRVNELLGGTIELQSDR